MSDNFLSSINFELVIKRIPNTTYSLQTANLPGLSMGEIEQPNLHGGRIMRAGSKLNYDEFNISFKVDDDFQNWAEIHRWMVGLTRPQEFEQFKNLKDNEGLYSDASLIMFNNSKQPHVQAVFKNLFPKSLSQIDFDSKAQSMEFITATASFRYDYFDINPIINA